jgi:hypothetical protein
VRQNFANQRHAFDLTIERDIRGVAVRLNRDFASSSSYAAAVVFGA